jgi:hypothetical protein
LDLSGGKARLYLGSLAEVESFLRRRPDLSFIPFYEFLAALEKEKGLSVASAAARPVQTLFQLLDLDLMRGVPIYFTRNSLQALASPRGHDSWRQFLGLLRGRYDLQPIKHGSFEAFLVQSSRD